MAHEMETTTDVDGALEDATPIDQAVAVTQQAPRDPDCVPRGMTREITKALLPIRENRKRPLFVLASSRIDEEDLTSVYSWRRELQKAGKEGPIDILIHSPGGELTSCYRIARLFSCYLDSWTALIPELAASGATLICLGSENLVMSDFAQLGPVDPQVVSRRQQRFFVSESQSPTEAFQAVKYLREFALSSLDAYMTFLLRKGLAPQTALQAARSVSAELVGPILAKIDPYDLGSFALDSDLAVQYCERIGRPDITKSTQSNVDYAKLVEAYPAHAFVIDRAEAESLDFEVQKADDELEDSFSAAASALDHAAFFIGFVGPTEKE